MEAQVDNPFDPVLLRIYEHDACELCRHFIETLKDIRLSFPVYLERMDIHRHPRFVRNYGLRVPVLDIGGVLELEAPIDRKDVIRALKQYMRYRKQASIYRKRWTWLARLEKRSAEKGRTARLRKAFAGWVLNNTEIHRQLRVLELAIGPGVNAEWYPEPWRVFGIDWIPGWQDSIHGPLRSFRFITADAHALPFRDASFDLVISTFSNCAFFNPARVVSEVARVLVDGGLWATLDHGAGPLPVHLIQKMIRPVWFHWVGCFPDRKIPRLLADPPFFSWNVRTFMGGLIVMMMGRRRHRSSKVSNH